MKDLLEGKAGAGSLDGTCVSVNMESLRYVMLVSAWAVLDRYCRNKEAISLAFLSKRNRVCIVIDRSSQKKKKLFFCS
jgi:hypothetical protein